MRKVLSVILIISLLITVAYPFLFAYFKLFSKDSYLNPDKEHLEYQDIFVVPDKHGESLYDINFLKHNKKEAFYDEFDTINENLSKCTFSPLNRLSASLFCANSYQSDTLATISFLISESFTYDEFILNASLVEKNDNFYIVCGNFDWHCVLQIDASDARDTLIESVSSLPNKGIPVWTMFGYPFPIKVVVFIALEVAALLFIIISSVKNGIKRKKNS